MSVFNIFGLTGSIVPIAYYVMVRSDFCNRAHNEISSWAKFCLNWLEAQITFRESRGEAYSSISSSRRPTLFYQASKHSTLVLIIAYWEKKYFPRPIYLVQEKGLMFHSITILTEFGQYFWDKQILECGHKKPNKPSQQQFTG